MQTYTYNQADPCRESGEDLLYLDIETTGLDRKRTILYLIGCGYVKDGIWQSIQWFNDDAISEEEMLCRLRDLLDQKNWTIVTFNGESFDLPYLKDHFQMNECDCDLSSYPSVDYFRILRPFLGLFGLEHGRQKDWERFLGMIREDRYSGRQLITKYKQYLNTHSEDLLELLLLHNREDIFGLRCLQPLKAYPALWKGDIWKTELLPGENKTGPVLSVRCCLSLPVPVPICISKDQFSLKAKGDSCTFTLPLIRDDLKYYYTNYKDYYYLPLEDRAIHKSVGQYVDRSHRLKAKPSTCYIRKNGEYLPAPLPRKKYGFPIGQLPDLTGQYHPFRKEYTDKRWYIEREEFSDTGNQGMIDYLVGMLNEMSIRLLEEKGGTKIEKT